MLTPYFLFPLNLLSHSNQSVCSHADYIQDCRYRTRIEKPKDNPVHPIPDPADHDPKSFFALHWREYAEQNERYDNNQYCCGDFGSHFRVHSLSFLCIRLFHPSLSRFHPSARTPENGRLPAIFHCNYAHLPPQVRTILCRSYRQVTISSIFAFAFRDTAVVHFFFQPDGLPGKQPKIFIYSLSKLQNWQVYNSSYNTY